MEIIIISLLVGCGLGVSNLVSEKWLGYVDQVVMLLVFVILIGVGVQIGSNHELIANLPVMGWKALVIAGLSTGGSILAVWLVVIKFDLSQPAEIKEKAL